MLYCYFSVVFWIVCLDSLVASFHISIHLRKQIPQFLTLNFQLSILILQTDRKLPLIDLGAVDGQRAGTALGISGDAGVSAEEDDPVAEAAALLRRQKLA